MWRSRDCSYQRQFFMAFTKTPASEGGRRYKSKRRWPLVAATFRVAILAKQDSKAHQRWKRLRSGGFYLLQGRGYFGDIGDDWDVVIFYPGHLSVFIHDDDGAP